MLDINEIAHATELSNKAEDQDVLHLALVIYKALKKLVKKYQLDGYFTLNEDGEELEDFADAMSGMRDNFDMDMVKQGGISALPNFINALVGNNNQNNPMGNNNFNNPMGINNQNNQLGNMNAQSNNNNNFNKPTNPEVQPQQQNNKPGEEEYRFTRYKKPALTVLKNLGNRVTYMVYF